MISRYIALSVSLLMLALQPSGELAAQSPDSSAMQRFDTTFSFTEIDHPGLHVGGIASFSPESYSVRMRGLPEVPSCCPDYTDGSGNAFGFSLLAGHHLTPELRLIGRFGFVLSGGDFTRIEEEVVDGYFGSVTGQIEHQISTTRSVLRIAPGVEFYLLPDLFLIGSIPLDLSLGGSFEQRETLLSPTNVRFENDRRIRNERSGTIPDLNFANLGVRAGVGYQLPLNSERTLLLTPQATFGFDLTERVTGTSWRIRSLDLELGVRYQLGRHTEVITDTMFIPRPMPIVLDTLPLVRIATEEQSYLDTLGMQIVRTSTLVPLLSDIFFDDGSSELPDRYITSTVDEAGAFSESTINGEAFDIYYRALDIIGSRMRRYPEATLNLVGCNTDVGVERNNLELSAERAATIRDYLTEVWSIDSGRIALSARDLPERPSPTRNEDGRSENRRVEMRSNDYRILEPVITYDTTFRPDRSVLYFEVLNPTEYASWRVIASQGENTIMDESGTGSPPSRVPLVLASGAIVVRLSNEPIDFRVLLTDHEGKERADSGKILVQRESTMRSGAEAYWMVVFGYNKRTLDEESRRTIGLVDDWTERRSGFIVELVGQTDRTGNAEYNRKLSVARATSVVNELGDGEEKMRGVGNSILEYPNDLPEGRYYSRNVKIVTRTDID